MVVRLAADSGREVVDPVPGLAGQCRSCCCLLVLVILLYEIEEEAPDPLARSGRSVLQLQLFTSAIT